MTATEAAKSITHWVFCDVGGMLDVRQVRAALELDLATGSPMPTEEEIETMITEEATHPEVLRLNRLYPALDAFLTEQLT